MQQHKKEKHFTSSSCAKLAVLISFLVLLLLKKKKKRENHSRCKPLALVEMKPRNLRVMSKQTGWQTPMAPLKLLTPFISHVSYTIFFVLIFVFPFLF